LDTAGITARYVKFRSLSEVNGKPWTTVAEFYAQGCIPPLPSSVTEGMNALSIYPNPTSGMVTIPISGVNINNIEIIDARGRIVRTIEGQFDQNDIMIDCSGIGTGIYQIRLHGINGAMYRCSIVIQ